MNLVFLDSYRKNTINSISRTIS